MSKGANMVWVNDHEEIRRHARSVFLKYMLDEIGRKKVEVGWERDLSLVQSWQGRVEALNLAELSTNDFVGLWKEMGDVLSTFWTNIAVPELGNYGADKLIEDEIKNTVKNPAEVAKVMEALTAPEEPSFFQREEMDLSCSADLVGHTKKYFWLENSYNDTKVLGIEYFKKRKNNLAGNIEENFKSDLVKKKNTKERVVKEHHLSEYAVALSQAFVRGVEWQDERKKMILIYLHYKTTMLDEAVQRLSVAKNDLLNFGTDEILAMLNGKMPSANDLVERRTAFVLSMDVLEKPKFIGGKTALEYWDLYAEEKSQGGESELRGIVVSRSVTIVRGRVSVVLDPKNSDAFVSGDILVAPMTTPEYIFAMKKASAVITDTGGLMSHAAVTSRELKIPCIVGTKIATKVLKDGDLVEVDAEKGIVRIIKN